MPRKQKFGPIKYTSRDYDSIRADLIDYAKRHYSQTFTDFSDASFGSLMIDTVSYVGDILSFYLDYQVNELFLDSTSEMDNVIRIARQMGYKHRYSTVSQGVVSFFIAVPEDLDLSLYPTLSRGASIVSDSGNRFTLTEDVNFSNFEQEQVALLPGNVRKKILKASGRVVSGLTEVKTFNIGAFKKFQTLRIARGNIFEIVSVTDSEGNRYFEVDNLAQNVIYRAVPNTGPDKTLAPFIMVPKVVDRRFMVQQDKNSTSLVFGYGSDPTLTTSVVDDPKSVAIDFYGKDYISDKTFDPSRMIETDKFGIAPSNTTITVEYSYNDSNSMNADVDSLTTIRESFLTFPDQASPSDAVRGEIEGSIECTNLEPITGDTTPLDIEETKMRVFQTFSSQNRAVTKEDYKALAYQMPGVFGSIRKCNIVQDFESKRRAINLYVLSENSDGTLVKANSSVKRNLKTWITKYKMINDTIDIMDGEFVNLGVEYVVMSNQEVPALELRSECDSRLAAELNTRSLELGEHFYLTRIYDTLRKIDGVLDVLEVTLYRVTGNEYSDTYFDVRQQMSPDGRYLIAPHNVAFEFKDISKNIIGGIA